MISLAPSASEKEFSQAVVDLARWLGWACFRVHDSRRSPAGYPDLTLARDRLIFAELKSEHGRLTPEQREWLARLGAVAERSGGLVQVEVWRPRDMNVIEAELRRRVK